MKYRALLQESAEGIAVSVPSLPGCHSQGANEQEALENIADAIREYVEVLTEQYRGANTREVEVEM
jgi:predicted RNase H-like HicB family nuclease